MLTSALMKKNKLFAFFCLLFLFPSMIVRADPTPTPTEFIKYSDDLIRGDSNQGIYTMHIKTPTWERKLKMHVYSLGREKIFIRILSPDKEKGIGTLRIKNEMWNYLPRVEKTIKIPPSLMLQPWMGSDFSNDDLVKENSIVDDYTHSLLKVEEIDRKEFYVIELRPKEHSAIVWGKIVRWIRGYDYIPLKEEYYDEKGKLIKVLEYSDITPVSDRIIPRVWKMRPVHKPGYETTIELVDVTYNQPIDEQIFTLTNLKKIQ